MSASACDFPTCRLSCIAVALRFLFLLRGGSGMRFHFSKKSGRVTGDRCSSTMCLRWPCRECKEHITRTGLETQELPWQLPLPLLHIFSTFLDRLSRGTCSIVDEVVCNRLLTGPRSPLGRFHPFTGGGGKSSGTPILTPNPSEQLVVCFPVGSFSPCMKKKLYDSECPVALQAPRALNTLETRQPEITSLFTAQDLVTVMHLPAEIVRGHRANPVPG